MIVRGPAAATVPLSRYLGYSLSPESSWGWHHSYCEGAFVDIREDGQTDIDDAIGADMVIAGWWKAAALRSDLGEPDALRPSSLEAPSAHWPNSGPQTEGPC